MIFMHILGLDASSLPNILAIAFASINFIFPSKSINKLICHTDDSIFMKETYNEIRW
jgi:hypothetical protein